jgi:hypothetical protein
MSKQFTLDEDSETWEPGDIICWADATPGLFVITENCRTYERVYWREDGHGMPDQGDEYAEGYSQITDYETLCRSALAKLSDDTEPTPNDDRMILSIILREVIWRTWLSCSPIDQIHHNVPSNSFFSSITRPQPNGLLHDLKLSVKQANRSWQLIGRPLLVAPSGSRKQEILKSYSSWSIDIEHNGILFVIRMDVGSAVRIPGVQIDWHFYIKEQATNG